MLCTYERQPVLPEFCQTTKRVTKAISIASIAAQAVFAKADVLSRVLAVLPVGMLPMLCCVSKAISEASRDPSLNGHYKLLTFQWERIKVSDADVPGDSSTASSRHVWRESQVWVKPEIPVPLQKWVVNTRCPAIGSHLSTCSAKGNPVTLREMKVTAVKLRDVTCPDGEIYIWKRPKPEPTEEEKKREEEEAERKRLEAEKEAKEEAEAEAAAAVPVEIPKLTTGEAVEEFLAMVLAQDLDGMGVCLDEKNVDINARDPAGFSALALAQENLKMRSERWLKARGARRIMPRGAAGSLFF